MSDQQIYQHYDINDPCASGRYHDQYVTTKLIKRAGLMPHITVVDTYDAILVLLTRMAASTKNDVEWFSITPYGEFEITSSEYVSVLKFHQPPAKHGQFKVKDAKTNEVLEINMLKYDQTAADYYDNCLILMSPTLSDSNDGSGFFCTLTSLSPMALSARLIARIDWHRLPSEDESALKHTQGLTSAAQWNVRASCPLVLDMGLADPSIDLSLDTAVVSLLQTTLQSMHFSQILKEGRLCMYGCLPPALVLLYWRLSDGASLWESLCVRLSLLAPLFVVRFFYAKRERSMLRHATNRAARKRWLECFVSPSARAVSAPAWLDVADDQATMVWKYGSFVVLLLFLPVFVTLVSSIAMTCQGCSDPWVYYMLTQHVLLTGTGIEIETFKMPAPSDRMNAVLPVIWLVMLDSTFQASLIAFSRFWYPKRLNRKTIPERNSAIRAHSSRRHIEFSNKYVGILCVVTLAAFFILIEVSIGLRTSGVGVSLGSSIFGSVIIALSMLIVEVLIAGPEASGLSWFSISTRYIRWLRPGSNRLHEARTIPSAQLGRKAGG